MKKIEIESQLNFPEYVKLMFRLTYRKPLMIILTVVGIFLLFLGIRYVIVFDKWDDIPYQMLIFGFVFTFILPISTYWGAKRNFNSAPRLREKMIYSFDSEEFHTLGESFNTSMSWEKVYKVQELNDWLLIYHNKLVASLIPKSSFSKEEFDGLKEIILSYPNLKTKLKKKA